MNQTNDLVKDVKLIIKTCERKATEANMTEQQKKDYINKVLMEYAENNLKIFYWSKDKMKEFISTCESAYSEFSKDEFFRYVMFHTSNTDIIFNEKLRIEEMLKIIAKRIAEIKSTLKIENSLHTSSITSSSLKREIVELQNLQKGLRNQCKKYDKRLPENLRGSERRREQVEAIGSVETYNYIDEKLKTIKDSKDNEKSVDERVFEFYKTFIGHKTENWNNFFYDRGVSEDIFNVFVRRVPSFKKYLKNKLKDLIREKDSIYKEMEKIRIIKRELEKKVVCIKNNPTESVKKNRKLGFEPDFFYRQIDESKVNGKQIPSSNLSEVEQQLEIMIAEEKKDSIELNEQLMELYLRQVQNDGWGNYILRDMHDMFVRKYPPFKEYLEGLKNYLGEISNKEKELEQKSNDLRKQIDSYNVHYDGHPDGYSTEDCVMFYEGR